MATEMFQMRQRMLSVGDDYWIDNGLGQHAYRVDGKVLRLRRTFVLEDAAGTELLKIHSKVLRVRETFVIERGGETVATLHKALVGFRDRYAIDLGDAGELHAQGNIVDHEYTVTRGGDVVAQVNKHWMKVRDTYGVAIAQGEDVPLLLAVVVCVDAISHEHR
ncbi:LURP-one-related/scramblase family protein [Actinomadura parmotrematis]|uniref:LURP-one-related family protein n=1 Tax=Actinomadura parmotrematis TaxID=2864039 RepID=A0ABS7FNC8_9ACTN|nr:LURP-one-related family protein [Actinomadura parmotrematis]MBW8481880.1 LURP-one-related family protein [Actinomadura parmotrematis]